MMQTLRRIIITLTGAVFLTAIWGAPAYAAEPALTVTQKKNYEQTLSGADAQTKNKLKKEYDDFEALMKSSKEIDQKIIDLHGQNAVNETNLRKQIQKIDEAKIAKLKAEADQTKARFQNLLDLYSTVNLQLSSARKLKNKTLTALYKAQADSLKIPVQLAKQTIKAKNDAYQNAKKTANAKKKKIRDTLSGIDPLKAQIRTAKSSLKAPKDSRWTTWKSFTSTLTKTHRNAKTAANLLASVNQSTRQIIQLQQKIYTLETKVADIIRKAETELANSQK